MNARNANVGGGPGEFGCQVLGFVQRARLDRSIGANEVDGSETFIAPRSTALHDFYDILIRKGQVGPVLCLRGWRFSIDETEQTIGIPLTYIGSTTGVVVTGTSIGGTSC